MYTSLSVEKQEIRILRIIPASVHDHSTAIECSLSTVSLQDNPVYDALSYVWGDAKVTETILVDGQHFEATKNLVAGLREMRKSSQSNPIWIDAICINQKSVEEKNQQVPFMQAIYRGAKTTLVWLGESNNESRLAFQLLTRWDTAYKGGLKLMRKKKISSRRSARGASSNHDDLEEDFRFREVARRTTRDHMAGILHPTFDGKEYDALLNFLSLPYWRRAWITQEFALSKRLVFLAIQNYELLHGLETVLSVKHLEQITICHSQPLEALIGLKKRYADPHNVKYMSLFELVNMNKNGMATHPVDRLYALLGLCDLSKLRVSVDYSRPYANVFQDLTEIFLGDPSVGTNCFCLTGGTLQEPLPSDLPSWVPNYANPGFLCDGNQEFYDWSDSKLRANAVISHNQLELNCIFGDVVKNVRHWSEDAETLFDALEVWLDMALAGTKLHPSGFPALHVFFRTLICDHSGQGFGKVGLKSKFHELGFFRAAAGFMEMLSRMVVLSLHRKAVPLPSCSDDWYRLLSPYLSPAECQSLLALDAPITIRAFALWLVMSPLKLDNISVTSVLDEFLGSKDSSAFVPAPNLDEHFSRGSALFDLLQQFINPSRSRQDSFFVTGDGNMGLGPQAVRPGDYLCSVPGCRYPLVVRPMSNDFDYGKEHFRVVGACYVYGMMDGEVAKDLGVEEKMRRVVFV